MSASDSPPDQPTRPDACWQTIRGETPIDPSGLRDRSITTRGELNVAEIEGVRRVSVKYLRSQAAARLAPFDYSWLCCLHREMLDKVWCWAGEIRKENLNIGVAWHQVQPQLMSFIDDIHLWSTAAPSPPDRTYLLEHAVRIHHRAVYIHPFPNGNGRWARLLSNIWLRRHSGLLVMWAEEVIGTASVLRDEYIDAIKAADGGNMKPLIRLEDSHCREVD